MAPKSSKDGKNHRPDIVNKKAYRDYEIVETCEAGLALVGSEVKSLRGGNADLKGSYARIDGGQCWLLGATIALYEQAGILNHDPKRKRKLLLHKSQIHKINTKLELRGFTLVPLRLYFSDRGLAKIELALARGKRQYDKRKSITEKSQKKDIQKDIRKFRKR